MTTSTEQEAYKAFLDAKDRTGLHLSCMAGPLLLTGRLVYFDPNVVCRCLHVYVYTDGKLREQWLGRPEAVVAFVDDNRRSFVMSWPGMEEKFSLRLSNDLDDAGKPATATLGAKDRHRGRKDWGRGRSSPQTRLTWAEFEKLFLLAKAMMPTVAAMVEREAAAEAAKKEKADG